MNSTKREGENVSQQAAQQILDNITVNSFREMQRLNRASGIAAIISRYCDPVESKSQPDYKVIAERNFRWAYQLLLALAKRRLAQANATREDDNDWPAGQEWHEMVGSSHSIFLRGARKEAGIPEDAFMCVVRSSECNVDDLYEAAAKGDR